MWKFSVQGQRNKRSVPCQLAHFTAIASFIIFIGYSLAVPLPVRAQNERELSRPTLDTGASVVAGRHFIILIDDSGSIAGRAVLSGDKRPAIRAGLPEKLFGDGKGELDFNPKQDRVSVLFFTIRQSGCGTRQSRSVLPENIFELAYTGKLSDKGDFSNKLAGWLNGACRFSGNWSPIVTSSLLALPYLQKNAPDIPPDELHTRTIMIQVTDGLFNSRTTPGHELTDYRRTGEINLKSIDDADDLLNRTARLFSLNIFPNQKPLNGVFYLTAEYTPQRVPESAIQYQRNSLLYPQALSSSALRYRLNDQLLGDIQLLSQGAGADFNFKPLWLRVGFQNEQGGDWSLGGQSLPRQPAQLDLTGCAAPQCRQESDRLGVGLFEAGLGGAQNVSRYSAAPEPGRIKFHVGFHYDTDVYKHLCAETPELEIKAKPAPPAKIPNFYFLPASTVGRADVVAEWEQDDDGITIQEEAKNRIQTRRNLKELLALFVFILAAIGLMIRYYQRRFAPELEWLAAPKPPVIDFNRPGENRLLVGALKVVNDEQAPWLGRWLKNEEQPTRPATVELSYKPFKTSARARTAGNGRPADSARPPFANNSEIEVADGNPIGFVQAAEPRANGQTGLNLFTEEAVSDGKQIHVFLATEFINDCQSSAVSEEGLHFDFSFQAELAWSPVSKANYEKGKTFARLLRRLRTSLAADRAGQCTLPVQCQLAVKPEEPRKPIVTFEPSAVDQLHFKKGEWIEVGQFLFESQAEHSFARAYEWGEYTIQTYLDNRQLGGEPIRLGQAHVTVRSYETAAVPVYLYCDGQTVPNPDPAFCTYEFKLVGDFHPESKPGLYKVTLHRDPTRTEIELKLRYQMQETELYWTSSRELKLQSRGGDANVEPRRRDKETIVLSAQTIKFSPRNALSRALFSIEVGNSGTVGRGVVAVDISARLLAPPASLELESGRSLEDLLGVYIEATQTRKPQVLVPESEKAAGRNPQVRDVRFNPGYIEKIPTARISAEHLSAEVKLAILVRTDQGETVERKLTILVPLTLEQLPGLNWLAIDFGTSAITAALGTGRQDGAMLIPLQQIKVANGRSFAEFDTENAERSNPYLLPSWVACDSELRKPSGDQQRPGFSGYYSKQLSYTPGEADFLSLPAVNHDFEENPDRIIYSLKSWLGKASGSIQLGRKIRVKEKDKLVERDTLPLQEVVESGFAALAQAYLLVNDQQYRADQIVLAHPNTFTRHHQDLLHNIAYRALGTRFGIPLAERIRLISESDAVAYFYCKQQMNQGTTRTGTERLLVYDFGAGTLDLSLIKIEWKGGQGSFPKRWQVEKRLGVPVAGHYLDELLARLIHELLQDPAITEPGKFSYRFPVVSRTFKESKDKHSRAIIHLWNWIREAKHQWSAACREVFAKGGNWKDCPALQVKVGVSGNPEVVDYLGGEVARTPQEDAAGLWVESGSFYLSIPAQRIQEDARLKHFTEFVTQEVIEELLAVAGLTAKEVNTVIVSGRGVLYPGLRDLIWKRFPNAERPDLLAGKTMKEAVVLGAIARQELAGQLEDASAEAELTPRLAVLINDDQELIYEKDWDKPIDLTASRTFRVVQVGLREPSPRKDMRSLRQHFYIDVAGQYFRREDVLGDGTQLYVRKRQHEGRMALYLEGQGSSIPITDLQVTRTVTTPPWPVGNILLDPQN